MNSKSTYYEVYLLTFGTIFFYMQVMAAPTEITTANKSTYFDSNNEWKTSNPTNFPDGLTIRGITGIIEDKLLLFGSNAKFIIENDGTNGAHVELHGCILSPSDGDSWIGVVLDGNSSEQQLDLSGNNFNSEQSRLFILPYNGTRSMIEKSDIGIKIG